MILAQTTLATPDVSWLAIGPMAILGVGAAVLLLVDVQFSPGIRRLGWLAGLFLAAALGVSVMQWFRVDELLTAPGSADFAAGFVPFGQMIVMDHASVLANMAMAVVAGLGIAGGWGVFEVLNRRGPEALALVLLATSGFMLMGSSLHLVMMFLGLEVGSIALYVLAGITRRRETDEAAIKYFLLGSVASAVFIYGVALTFAGTGQLNLVSAQAFLDANIITRPAVLLIGLALLVVGLAFKISAAPFHSWAPDVYQGAPAGVVGFMAAAAKIGGFAALMRILLTAFPDLVSDWAPLVAAIAALSMGVGGVLALVQDDVRRLLAYSGVTHAGFILVGLVAGAAADIGDVWFYLAVYTLQLVGSFAVVAAVIGADGGPASMDRFAGLAQRQPLLATTFAVLLLGMAGLPLTSGFVAKFGVFQSAWEGGFEWLVIVAVLASVVGFAFYLKVIVAMFMRDPEGEVAAPALSSRVVVVVTALATVVLGLLPDPLLELVSNAIPL